MRQSAAGRDDRGDLPSASDHFDGRKFFNPGVDTDKTFREFLRWTLAGGRSSWPKHVANPTWPPLPPPNRPDTITLTFIGQSTFLIQAAGLNVLTDPIFSERASPVAWAGPRRARAPGIRFEALPPIDVVLLSHNHYDHMDLPTLRRLRQRDRPTILTGLRNGAYLRAKGMPGAVELDWWESAAVRPDIRISYVPAQHWSRRTLFDRRDMLWGGFVVEMGVGRLYFAGDTGYGPHFRAIRERFGTIEVALLPIGAYEARWFMQVQHMNPDDAVRAHLDLGAELSIGMHFGTFQLTDEPIDAPPEALAAARQARGIPDHAFRVPQFGEPIVWRAADQALASTGKAPSISA